LGKLHAAHSALYRCLAGNRVLQVTNDRFGIAINVRSFPHSDRITASRRSTRGLTPRRPYISPRSLAQVSAAGSDAIAVVYLAGFGPQFEGENYFVPIDADIQRDVDIPLQAIRISDFIQPLAALPGRVKIVILDASHQNPFVRSSQPLAGGLALIDPAPSLAIAFSAAPRHNGPGGTGSLRRICDIIRGNDRGGGTEL
jgi:hypothetical protein